MPKNVSIALNGAQWLSAYAARSCLNLGTVRYRIMTAGADMIAFVIISPHPTVSKQLHRQRDGAAFMLANERRSRTRMLGCELVVQIGGVTSGDD